MGHKGQALASSSALPDEGRHVIASRLCCSLTLRDRRLKGRYRTRVGASMEACAVQKTPIARKGRGGTDARESARGRLDAPDAAGAEAMGDGRYPDRARRPAAADGWRGHKAGRVARVASAVTARPVGAPVPTVAENGPEAERPSRRGAARNATMPERNLTIAERHGREAGRPLREGKHGWAVLRHTPTGASDTASTPHATCRPDDSWSHPCLPLRPASAADSLTTFQKLSSLKDCLPLRFTIQYSIMIPF